MMKLASVWPAGQPAPSTGQNFASTIATRLRNDIVSGRRPPGARLSIEELKGDFGVSLSPLREALARLATEGFVVNEDKKGFKVAPVSRENLLEVAKLQSTLEPMALRESIRHGNRDWEDGIVLTHHRLSRYERPEQKDGGGVDEWEAHHREFHLALLAACRMPLALMVCDSLQHFSARYRRLFLAYKPFDRDVAQEHRSLVDATLDRKEDLAAEILAEHIERTARNILAALDAGGVAAAS
ncbi:MULTISPECIES: GntR family transcriptional regulator [unclassified Pigmentiphaga]|uniref:GntR family transcriptional regulator n=1 Tax=unclassified Pigmentiphaga TaxID=2626614 RepID=UPI001FB85C7E|nr:MULTISPECIES: GntR family transcriptional regulator [unclassified Pigmentiphaga]